MTETPVKGLILTLSVPTIISNLISTLYNAADTFFVGQISTSASAAVGVALSLQAVIQAIGFFFGQGSGNNMSRRLGAHDEKTAEELASTGFFSSLLLSVAITVIGIIFLRPLAIFLCSLFFKDRFNFRNQIFVSWVGLRGAAAIVFATYPLLAGIPNADMMFSLVFFIAFSSMVLQGSTIPWVAKRLKLAYELPPALLSRKDLDTKTELIEIMVRKGSSLDNQTLLEAQLPDDTRVTMIMRKGEYIVPSGNTRLQAKDHLYVICKNPDEVRRLVS